jgi:hypothetical protein
MIKTLYLRLIAAGKVKKAAMTACTHKLLIILHGILRDATPWNSQINNQLLTQNTVAQRERACLIPWNSTSSVFSREFAMIQNSRTSNSIHGQLAA